MQENIPHKTAGADGGSIVEPVKFEPVGTDTRRLNLWPKTGTLLVGAALLFCAGLAWYIVTGKAVYIETFPAQANVDISGGLKLKLADRYLLRRGDYQLGITAEGYYPVKRTLNVTGERNQQHAVALQPLPGHLNIGTTPAVNADILLNGAMVGQTPATLSGLEPGKYRLQLVTDRFLPYETAIEIEGLDREQVLNAELEPAWADITIQSNPPGAEIFVDDKKVGDTPFIAEILQGEHKLRVKLPGYKAWQRALRVTAGIEQTLDGIDLEPADAVVQIVTIPEKANVTIDGEYVGQSPLEAALTPGSQATIRIFKQGYETVSRTVETKSGDSKTLTFNLAAETAPVRIVASPADARIYIDGQYRGLADQTVELSTTSHDIEINRDGYVSYKTTITPRPGIPQQITVGLKTVEQARLDAVKPVIESPAGQQLKLFKATSVIMGASRREPGRRANEIERRVRFERLFYLSETEVTNAQFRKFDGSHSSGHVQGKSLDGENQPVVNITWEQAALYCNWLSEQESLEPFYRVTDGKITGINPTSLGYRLPTEAEWAWAARDMGNGDLLRYPWGEDMPPKPKSGNYADVSAAALISNIIRDYKDEYAVSAPVASFQANAKGLYDMGGNVAEWVHDFYDITLPVNEWITDPLGPETGQHHIIRGSSWAHGTITELRLSYRDYGSEKRSDVGFRVARYIQ